MLSAIETNCEVKRTLQAEMYPNWFLKHRKEVRQKVGDIDEDMGEHGILELASILMWL